jgi:hypothetical protein
MVVFAGVGTIGFFVMIAGFLIMAWSRSVV